MRSNTRGYKTIVFNTVRSDERSERRARETTARQQRKRKRHERHVSWRDKRF